MQMTVRMLDYGQNPQAAADAPRWKVSKSGELLLEPSLAPAVVEGLRDLGHRVRVSKKGEAEIGSYGSAQLIYRVEGGYVAGSEGRRDGQAVGF
jgi:gamma-glutamyltranspeptidase/glutathione hydrolase